MRHGNLPSTICNCMHHRCYDRLAMKALLLFHAKVGVRVAVRSFVPLFCAALVVVMLHMYPAALVTMIALRLFAAEPSFGDYFAFAVLAFLLPASAVPRLVHGLNGWMRHLPISGVGNRRGLALALAMVQLPLAFTLVLLGLVAYGKGRAIALPGLRLSLLLAAGAFAAVPAKRHVVSVSFALAATALIVGGPGLAIFPAAGLLAAADFSAGPLRETRRARAWRPVGALFTFRTAIRALGASLSGPYLVSLIPIGGALLFIANNTPPAAIAAGAGRLAGGLALVFFLSGLTDRLMVRRPVWPWSRSLPWSALSRVAADAGVFSTLAVPLILVAAAVDPWAALSSAALLPLLSLRAAACIRRARELKSGAGSLTMEGFFVSAIVALLPAGCLLVLAAAPAALFTARRAELRLKPTRWVEQHHLSAGDSLSWSE